MQPEPRSQEPQQQAGQQRSQASPGQSSGARRRGCCAGTTATREMEMGQGKARKVFFRVHRGHQTSPAEQGDGKAGGCFASDLGFCCE